MENHLSINLNLSWQWGITVNQSARGTCTTRRAFECFWGKKNMPELPELRRIAPIMNSSSDVRGALPELRRIAPIM